MWKNICYFSLIILVVSGCKTKFSVNGDYEEKPIVHFILDQGKKYQFLKLNKTFLKEGDANEFAKNAKLSYFDNVKAQVKEVQNGNVTRTWTLHDTMIHNKESGAFYAPDQKLYFFKADTLYDDAIYKLHIDIGNGKHIVTGQTAMIRGVNIVNPTPNQSFKFAENNVIANGYRNAPISFTTGENSAVYKMQLKFYYNEYTASGSEVKSLTWDLGTLSASDVIVSAPSITAAGENFYEFIGNKIEKNPKVTHRTLEALEILLTAGTKDLYTYILTNQPSTSIAQNKPTFSNVDGGLGIFTSRRTVSQYMPAFKAPYTRCLNKNSTKELCKGAYTADLKFCSDISLDIMNSYSCSN